jgi:hypothetical protein
MTPMTADCTSLVNRKVISSSSPLDHVYVVNDRRIVMMGRRRIRWWCWWGSWVMMMVQTGPRCSLGMVVFDVDYTRRASGAWARTCSWRCRVDVEISWYGDSGGRGSRRDDALDVARGSRFSMGSFSRVVLTRPSTTLSRLSWVSSWASRRAYIFHS